MSKLTSVDYIITAKHYSVRERADGTVRDRILKYRERLHKTKGITVQIKNIDKPSGKSVFARIELGQWIADCECGGAEFVDASEPIFFCFSCGNRANSGSPRPVSFPPEPERLEIERLVLLRPVDDTKGLTDLERAGQARALIMVEDLAGVLRPLTRTWDPGQTLDDLHREQDAAIAKWKKDLAKGGK